MHRPIFGHSLTVLMAPILLSVLAFSFFNKKKTCPRRNAEDVNTGTSGSLTAPIETNSDGSSLSLTEIDNVASSSSPTETNYGASSSLTTSIGNCYEVFLSFRGSNTRKGFIDHLYNGLLDAGINVFRGNDELCQGENIKPELMEAIMNSKILIPVLSVTYVTSSWCLDELVQIMECKNNNGQIVLPIFYKVKPADVRHQIERFGYTFHERERPINPTILEKWKKALNEVSTLKGYEANRSEAELVKSVVQKALSELKKSFELVISKNLVGIDSHVKMVMEFVDNNSHATLFVGIHGMGGIGKTTLAKAIYNKLFHQFEHRSFIADIRESCKRNGLHYLQNKLIYDMLKRENEVCNEDEGTKFISSMFKGYKVLVLLDDVDDVVQLRCLANNRDWFSLGSRIIITTRNKKVLEEAGVDYSYDHKEMGNDQSLILFSKHAFRRDSPPREFKDLTDQVVSITGGLPLSLEVLGSLLCGQKLAFWRGTIEKLKKGLPQNVQENLRISYDALNYVQKQIYLDIACFFIGTDRRIASYMWDTCSFFPEEEIELLRFMSLIKIGDDHKLLMHDQLRDLGRGIVREENQREPQNRSRLWDFEEVQKVLKQKKGTKNIEAIILSKGSSEGSGKTAEQDGDIYTAEQFRNLKKLRFLHLKGAHLSGDFKNSIEGLRWLRWPYCPIKFELNNFHVKGLAVLELSGSEINEKWKGWSSFMMAKKLKFLDLTSCQSLENTNFLSAFKNLEVLILNNCWGLQQIDPSIGDMNALLRLELCWCTSLMKLPVQIGFLQNLEILNISGSGIEELPNSIGRLRKLRNLDASYCINLKGEVPESMCNPSPLQRLDFLGRMELQSLPDLPSSLTYLGVTCQSRKLPSLSHLIHLKELRVIDCKFLECIQELPSTLLNNSECSQLTNIEESELPQSLNSPSELEILQVHWCESIETLDVSQFIHLRTLSAEYCTSLLEVRGLDKSKYLESLTVAWCDTIEWLDLPKFEGLKKLDVRDCDNLATIQGLDRLEFLERLDISRCTSIERLLLPKSRSLKTLNAGWCKKLVEIQGLDRLEFLEMLNIEGCTSIERLDLSKYGRLKELNVGDCENLAEIRGLDRLEFLKMLYIKGCTSIERLDIPKFGMLEKLEVGHCENLAEIQGLDWLDFLESLDISRCTSIERLLLPESRRLKTLYVYSCKKLVEIQGLDSLDFLEMLNIEGCTSIERLDLPESRSLKTLYVYSCKKLVEIQGLNRLEFLEMLNIEGCTSIERLDLPKYGRLKELNVGDCENLAEIRGLDSLEFLKMLYIKGCTSIERLDLPKFGMLEKLEVGHCENLAEIQGLDWLNFLESLDISRCTSIVRLLLPESRSLKTLFVYSCKKLVEIQGLDRLEFLEMLNIEGCTSIERLDLPKFGSLKELDAGDCENLVEIQGLDTMEFLEMLNIKGCTSIERLDLPKSGRLKKLDAGDYEKLSRNSRP